MLNFFSILRDTHYSFDGKKPYENVLLLLFRHWFVLVSRFLVFVFLALLPFVLYAFVQKYLEPYQGLEPLFWFLIAVYFLWWWYGLFYSLTMYLLDTWIVTDHRILDSEQHGFFRRSVAELNLAKIQDISVSVKGFIPTLLDFGDLEIQTAGAENKFHFKQVPHPNQVKDQIMHAHNQYVAVHKGNIEIHEEAGI